MTEIPKPPQEIIDEIKAKEDGMTDDELYRELSRNTARELPAWVSDRAKRIFAEIKAESRCEF